MMREKIPGICRCRGRRSPERRFYFRLARELGMTVSELLNRMDSAELTEWVALYKLENEERAHAQQVAQNRARQRR